MSARDAALDVATQHVAAANNSDMVTARLQIRTVISALRAAGFVVAPVEVTREMLQALPQSMDWTTAIMIYNRMLAATQEPDNAI